jgi:hypothetical protein
VKEPTPITHIESRWLVALAILGVFFLLALLPDRIKTFPNWVPCVLVIALVVAMAALHLATAKRWWLRIERAVTLAFILIAVFAVLASLEHLLAEMVLHSAELSSLTLLQSSIAVWATNLLIFSMTYWRMDQGGPEARANQASTKPDWLFPQESVPEKAPTDWRPTFIDYLFLAFNTATAFSPTDVMPLTSRAKVLMMVESIISLVTIIAVVARDQHTRRLRVSQERSSRTREHS